MTGKTAIAHYTRLSSSSRHLFQNDSECLIHPRQSSVETDLHASCILGVKLSKALSGFLFTCFFYLGPALFNRIQKRRVRRREQWFIATAFDSFYHIMRVVNRAVVHDNIEALLSCLSRTSITSRTKCTTW